MRAELPPKSAGNKALVKRDYKIVTYCTEHKGWIVKAQVLECLHYENRWVERKFRLGRQGRKLKLDSHQITSTPGRLTSVLPLCQENPNLTFRSSRNTNEAFTLVLCFCQK